MLHLCLCSLSCHLKTWLWPWIFRSGATWISAVWWISALWSFMGDWDCHWWLPRVFDLCPRDGLIELNFDTAMWYHTPRLLLMWSNETMNWQAYNQIHRNFDTDCRISLSSFWSSLSSTTCLWSSCLQVDPRWFNLVLMCGICHKLLNCLSPLWFQVGLIFKMATVGSSWLKLAQLCTGMSCWQCSDQQDSPVSKRNWEYLNMCHLSTFLEFCLENDPERERER